MSKHNLNRPAFGPTQRSSSSPSIGGKRRVATVTSSLVQDLKMPEPTQAFRAPISVNPPISPQNPPNKVMHEMDARMRGVNQLPTVDYSTPKQPEPAQPKAELEPREEPQEPIPPSSFEDVEHRAGDKIVSTNPFAERAILPSGCIFYDFKDIEIWPFQPANLAKLYKAIRNKDFMLFHDVLNSTINVDIRDLWTIDARYIMYWHKINSFVKSPYRVKWESIYGNTNKVTVNLAKVKITPIKMTRERYEFWQSKGLQIPTIRDDEHFQSFKSKLEDDDIWLYNRAKCIKSNGDLHEKKKMLESGDSLELLYLIKEFSSELADGEIEEYIEVTDSKFEYDKAVEKLKKDYEGIMAVLSEEMNLTEVMETFLTERSTLIKNELDRLLSLEPGEAEPMLETTQLQMSVFDFFPDL